MSNNPQKKALVFSSVPLWEVHLADTLEVVFLLRARGWEVVFLSCDGELSSCPANPHHKPSLCRLCRSTTQAVESTISSFCEVKRLSFNNANFEEKVSVSELNSLDDVLNFTYKGLRIGALAASQLADDKEGVYFDFNDPSIKNRVNSMIINGIKLFEESLRIFGEYNIEEVYAWNGRRPSDGPVLFAAKTMDLRYYSFISGGKVGHIQILESIGVHDLTAVKNDINLLSSKVDYSQIVEGSTKYYHDYITGGLNQVGYVDFSSSNNSENISIKEFNNEKPMLLVITSTPREKIHLIEHYEYYGTTPYEKLMSIFDDEIKQKYNIIVRWHPGKRNASDEDRNIIAKIIKESTDIIHYSPDSDVDTYKLLEFSSIVLSTGSTVGFIAAIKGKPLVVVGPNANLVSKSAYCAFSIEQARELLLSNLKPLPLTDIHRFGYWAGNFGSSMQHVYCDENKHWFIRHSSLSNSKGEDVSIGSLIAGRSLFVKIFYKFKMLLSRLMQSLEFNS